MNKHILLVSLNDSQYLENAGDRVPLGLLYIAAPLFQKGYNVQIVDLNHDHIEYTLQYNFIGIGFSTSQYHDAVELVKQLRHKFPKTKLIAGGVHPTIAPRSCLKYFDYVITGEAETCIVDVVEGKFKNKRIINAKPIKDLDTLPAPAWHLLDMDKYRMEINGVRTATMITSRGCPGSCVFCSRINGKFVRMHSAKAIYDEMIYLDNVHGFKSFYFLDDTFTYDEKRVLKLCKLIKDRGYQLRITTRADLVTERMMKALAEAGLKIISLGVEHASDRVLKLSGKGMTMLDNAIAIRYAHKYGVRVKGFFILNLPGANSETVKDTLTWAKIYCDYADFYRLVAFPGTSIWNHSSKLGLIIVDKSFGYWEAGLKKEYNVENINISNREIDKICRKSQCVL